MDVKRARLLDSLITSYWLDAVKADPVLEEKMSFYLLKFLLIASHLNHLE